MNVDKNSYFEKYFGIGNKASIVQRSLNKLGK